MCAIQTVFPQDILGRTPKTDTEIHNLSFTLKLNGILIEWRHALEVISNKQNLVIEKFGGFQHKQKRHVFKLEKISGISWCSYFTNLASRTMRSQDITQMQHKQKRSIIILGIVSYLIGIALMFNVHVFSRDTYISENALQPGSTNYYYDVNDYDFSVRVARDYIKVQKSFAKYISNEQWSRATASWLASRIRELGVEVYEEEFAVSSDSSMNSSSVTCVKSINKYQHPNNFSSSNFVADGM